MIENGPDALSQSGETVSLLWAFSAWAGDPAVLTAIASLLTALGAFFRLRHRRSGESPSQRREPPLPQAYKALSHVEERIREELLSQLQNLQEEAERLGRDLTICRQGHDSLREALRRCPQTVCEARDQLFEQR